MKDINLLLFAFLILLVGCKKNIDETNIINSPNPPIKGSEYIPEYEEVIGSIYGMVIDENGEPIEGAIISLDGETKLSSPFGAFKFENTELNKKGTFVKVEKDGYFISGRRFFPQNSTPKNIKIELIEKQFVHTFLASEGGNVNFDQGGKIEFSQESISDENGDPYLGEVKVAMKWLDPSMPETFDQMPGALQGLNLSEEEVGLVTYGMIAVELEGENGEQLNILKNKTAKIKIPVPSSIQDFAPEVIPLWSFSNEYGIWVEEEKANLENGFYIGEVSHFSFWNCDDNRPLTSIGFIVQDDLTSKPQENLKVKIIADNGAAVGFSYTDINGRIHGLIPSGEILELQIFNPCDEIIYSESIGPFNNHADLGSIFIDILPGINVTGELIDCDGNLVTEGILTFKLGGESFQKILTTNPFSFEVPRCSVTDEVELIGGNINNYEQGKPRFFPIADTIYAGRIETCGNPLDNYAIGIYDDIYTMIIPLTYVNEYFDGTDYNIRMYFQTLTEEFKINIKGNTPGDYSFTTNHFIEKVFFEFGPNAGHYGFVGQATGEVVITEYGQNIGDRISGYVNVPVVEAGLDWPYNDFVNYSVEFNILRDW